MLNRAIGTEPVPLTLLPPAYPANPGYTAPYTRSYGYDIYSAPRYGAYGYDYNRWHDREGYERRAWREYRERERREHEWREHERRERRSRGGGNW